MDTILGSEKDFVFSQTDVGAVTTFGHAGHGALGIGVTNSMIVSSPQQVHEITQEVSQISASGGKTCCVEAKTGLVYEFG